MLHMKYVMERKKMNSKKMKPIRRKAKHILVEWLQSLLSKQEASKINYKNVFATQFHPEKSGINGISIYNTLKMYN